jgi:virulence factor Mce-like protein
MGRDNTTEATLEMRSRYAPVPRDAKAMLRQKSLLGETYVDLSTGDRSGGSIPDGGTLASARVAPTVELDEIFRAFDDDTQQAFQTWMQAQAGSVEGRAADINATFGNLPEFVEASDDLLAELNAQSRAVSETVRGTGDFFSAISERDGQLARLITGSNRLFEVTAARNRDFAAIWKELPGFARESRLTLPRLTRFSQNARPVVRQLQPVATEMASTFEQVQRLSPELEQFFTGLGPVITASRRGVPALESLMQDFPPLLADFEPFLRNLNPMIAYLNLNRREVASFFANTTAGSVGRDIDVTNKPNAPVHDPAHFVRASAMFSPQGLAFYPRALGQTRRNPYTAPGWLDRLMSGLTSYNTGECANGDPAVPTEYPPDSQRLMDINALQRYIFRTADGSRNVARPACVDQGAYPGFATRFPQLEPEL